MFKAFDYSGDFYDLKIGRAYIGIETDKIEPGDTVIIEGEEYRVRGIERNAIAHWHSGQTVALLANLIV